MIQIGYTKKPHGLKGELKVQIFEEYEEDFFETEVVFLVLKGKNIPFFIEKISEGNVLVLKLEEVDSREDCAALAGKELFLRPQDIKERDVKTKISDLHFGHLEGFKIVDEEEGEIGTIIEVIEMPQQEMAVVDYKKKEIFIPLNEQLITNIEDNKKVVYMQLPLGILDM